MPWPISPAPATRTFDIAVMGATTAGKLSEVTGLTSGAVTRVIDRLEQAGYVRRVPDPTDRRRVIVEVIPEKVANIRVTLDRVESKGAEEMSEYSDAQLALINDFLEKMERVNREEAESLRQSREVATDGSPTSSEHVAPMGGLERARLAFRSGANELLLRGSSAFGDLYHAKFEGQVPHGREAPIRLERRPDPLSPLGHLIRRDRDAHERLGIDVVGEMARRIDDLHQPPPVDGRSADRIAAVTSVGR